MRPHRGRLICTLVLGSTAIGLSRLPFGGDLLFKVLPVDKLLVWRATGPLLAAFALGFLTYSMVPWLGRGWAAGVYSACILFAPLNLWTPNYKNLTLLSLCMAIGCLAIAQGRTPQLVVNRVQVRGRNSLERHIRNEFQPVWRRGPFQVWRPKQAIATP
jgi:hypothetical protein